MSTICPQCAIENEAWRPYCMQCGVSLHGTDPASAATENAGASSQTRNAEIQPPSPQPPSPQPPSPQPPSPQPPSPQPPSPQRASGATIALVAVLCLALAGGAAFGVYHLTRGDSRYPKSWDARIKPFADQAARIRGLEFVHPVRTIFHPEAQFMKLVTGGTGPTSSPSAAARSEADKKAAGLRAVGLADGKLDLLAQSKHLRSVSILAYYSETEKQVHIRGTEITINTQVTLVHELVHALQDQHYDLGKLGRLGNESKTDAVRSLIEGDAVWVEKQYLDGLSKQDRAAYFKANKDAGSKINQDTRDSVPDILVADQSAPYQFGPVLIEFLHHQGAAELDAAFQHPPLSDFLVFQPKRFLSGTVAQRGPKVQLPAGANKAQYEGEFGAIWWYSMLAERLDAHRVLDALDGWAGDELWTYEHNGKVCLALDWNAKNGATQTAMRTVLNAWRAKMPAASDITVTDRPSSTAIEVIACDPGIAVTTVTHQAKQQFSIPLVRAEVAQGLLHSAKDASTGAAWCVASKFVQRYTAAQLASDTAIPAREIRKVILELRRTCRSQPEFGA